MARHPTSRLDDYMLKHGILSSDVTASCGVTRETVRLWRRGLRRMSLVYAKLLESQFSVPRHITRPDVWTPPQAPPSPPSSPVIAKPRRGRPPRRRDDDEGQPPIQSAESTLAA
jgi:hypothetical protein